MMASFVLRVGLRPRIAQPVTLLRSSITGALEVSKRNVIHSTSVARFRTQIATLQHVRRSLPLFLAAGGIAGAALGISSLAPPTTLHCDDAPPFQPLPPLPKSSVNVYELTFGTVCGLCAGVFVKKSARMVAFFVGGLFVILQYLGSVSLVKVDWARMASRFENLFYTTDAFGNKKPPTVSSIWRWIVDFLTADFQPRASFLAGLTLGLRVG